MNANTETEKKTKTKTIKVTLAPTWIDNPDKGERAPPRVQGFAITRFANAVSVEIDGIKYRVGDHITEDVAERLNAREAVEVTVASTK